MDNNNDIFNKKSKLSGIETYNGSTALGNQEFSVFMAQALMRWVREIEGKAEELNLTLEDEAPEVKRQLGALLLTVGIVEDFRKGNY